MKHTEFFKKLQNGKTDNVYLFSGEESFVCESALKRLESAVVDENLRQVNVAVLDTKDGREIADACRIMPFGPGKRLVTVKNMPADGEKELLEYLDSPSEYTVLVFVIPAPDKRKKIIKALEKFEVQFNVLDSAELEKWVVQTARKAGSVISAENAKFLCEYSSASASSLACEIEKLTCLCKEREITRQDILDIVTPEQDYNVFKMIDCISTKNKKEALEILCTMLAQKEEPIYVLGAISRQIRQMLAIKIMQNSGKTKAEIVKALGIRDFVFDKLSRACAFRSEEELYASVEACYEADEGLKSGKQFPQVALHALTVRLCK